ncbi:PAAR domain-containing protein [Pseudomonas huanghezhanensis]|uniref:PAAR domain-containing protein n=1 Tax=Pseudomonas huanghezhanensis TaxID=3002903 RepID=UPI0038B445ED
MHTGDGRSAEASWRSQASASRLEGRIAHQRIEIKMKGHFLVRGDRTSCGGEILAGSPSFTFNGHERICEDDPVSCGKDGNIYKVTGGLDHFIYHGRRVAGTLDSFSGCPCKSRLLHSIDSATYESATHPLLSSRDATARKSQVLFRSSSSASTTSLFATQQPSNLRPCRSHRCS